MIYTPIYECQEERAKISHTIVSIRLEDHVLASVDKHAEAAAMSRNQYILQWLPENYDQPPAAMSENGDKQDT